MKAGRMKAWESVREALSLLTARDRRLLLLVVLLQATLSALDVIAVVLIGVIAALATGAVPGRLASLLDAVKGWLDLGDGATASLAAILGAFAAVLLVSKSICSFYIARRVFQFLARRQAIISSELSKRLLMRPLLEVQKRSSQTVGYALTMGVSALTLGIIGQSAVFVSEISLLVILSVALLVVDPVVMIFTVVFFSIVVLLMHRVIAVWASSLGRQAATTQVESFQAIDQLLRTYREVVVSGRRRVFVNRFSVLRWRVASVQADLQIVGQVSKYVFEVALVVGGGLLVVSQALTRDAAAAAAVIALFVVAASRIMPSLLRLQSAALTIRTSAGVAQPTFELARDLAHADQEGLSTFDQLGDDDRVTEGILHGHAGFVPNLRLDRVRFSYSSAAEPAIDEITLNVPEGTSLALVGTTGAGKSTLADLILGLLEPDSGKVLLAGRAPAEAIREWPGAVAYVPQDIAVINSDIRGNVALGLTTAQVDDDRIWEALERAQLADFLRDQREGLDTVVGELGFRLSGGQRQRLGLARALFTRPRFLVLDEATSALDADTEFAISSSISALAGEVTLIVIAHRLATVRNADQVVHLDRGHVSAIGTFEEVRSAVPAFNRQASLLGL